MPNLVPLKSLPICSERNVEFVWARHFPTAPRKSSHPTMLPTHGKGFSPARHHFAAIGSLVESFSCTWMRSMVRLPTKYSTSESTWLSVFMTFNMESPLQCWSGMPFYRPGFPDAHAHACPKIPYGASTSRLGDDSRCRSCKPPTPLTGQDLPLKRL
jgi:hypothetical protein